MFEVIKEIIYASALFMCLVCSGRYMNKGQYQEAWWFMALFATTVLGCALCR